MEISKLERENKNKIVKGIMKNKGVFISLAISIPVLILFILGCKNPEQMKKINSLIDDVIANAKKNKPVNLNSMSDSDLAAFREKVRLEYVKGGHSDREAIRLDNLLHKIDLIQSKKSWGDEIPHGPGIHHEHGYYLSNDD